MLSSFVRHCTGGFRQSFMHFEKRMQFRVCGVRSYLNALYITCFTLNASGIAGRTIQAGPSDYLLALSQLTSGDTLLLAPGLYTKNLTLKDLEGKAEAPIVITGARGNAKTIFQAQSCCNTVSLTRCGYVVIQYLYLDGNNLPVDAVKAEGTAGNYTHHITLQYLNITGYGHSQPIVGISTKCPSWNWIIRKNRIINAGTGLYLGNSAGDKPFVNGLIEYNYISNPIGYCMEIKHQFDGVRDGFPGTEVNGKTIIRHNVFEKGNRSSEGALARPSLLVGGFPGTGWGKDDYYDIYGNVFYNNPVEALFQGTGNIRLHTNIFINHFDPDGFRSVYFGPHNGVAPKDIIVLHNTVWARNSYGGIRLYNPDPAYRQICAGNAVFAPAAISGFAIDPTNTSGSYADAVSSFLSATTDIAKLDLHASTGKLMGTAPDTTGFSPPPSARFDFDGTLFHWQYRGAYSGSQPGDRSIVLDTLSNILTDRLSNTADRLEQLRSSYPELLCHPNPAQHIIRWTCPQELQGRTAFLISQNGQRVMTLHLSSEEANVSSLPKGNYFLWLENGTILTSIVKLD